MGLRKELSQYQRVKIIELRASGYRLKDVARIIKCSLWCVQLTLKRWTENKMIDSKERSGPPRKTTSRDDRNIMRVLKRQKDVNTNHIRTSLRAVNRDISNQTIRNRLHEFGLKGFLKRKVPFINKTNQQKRLHYARKHRNKTNRFWNNILYTDEVKIELTHNYGRTYIWRRQNEAYNEGNTQNTVKHSASVMCWGCFCANGVGDLIFIEGNMDAVMYSDILEDHVVTSAQRLGLKRGWQLLQDNDPKHTSNLAVTTRIKLKIKTIDHPPASPDLNPIEHLWHHLKRQIQFGDRSSMESFINTIKEEWSKITPETCRKLSESMSRRLDEVIKFNGRATSY